MNTKPRPQSSGPRTNRRRCDDGTGRSNRECGAERRGHHSEDHLFRGLRRNDGGQRCHRYLRHHGLGVHGRNGHLRPRRNRLHSRGPRAGRRAHGRWLRPRIGTSRGGHRSERAGHLELRDSDRRCLLGTFAGRHRHPGGRHELDRARWIPRGESAADVPGVHEVPGTCVQRVPHVRIHRPLLRPREVGNGSDPAEHPP